MNSLENRLIFKSFDITEVNVFRFYGGYCSGVDFIKMNYGCEHL